MSITSALFAFFAVVLICTLPRRFAAIPLLLTVTYVSRGAVLEIGSIHFTVLHLVVLFGICRTLLRNESLARGSNAVDRMLFLWAIVLVASSAFHTSGVLVFRMGTILAELGGYLLLRVFIQDTEDIVRVMKMLCVILLPVAVLMLMEKYAAQNYFVALGAQSEVIIRDGSVRARGPFAHPILAGTVGASCFPMALYLWKKHPIYCLSGLLATTGIVFSCKSSGPIMMLLFIFLGLCLWKMRGHLSLIRWFAVIGLVALDAVMKDPVYFIMARIDLTGSSTGWHRAELIRSAIEHVDEWWLAGTDYTRHWMPTGIHANEVQTDITNHLLLMGVNGGFLLMLIFILVLLAAFRIVGQSVRERGNLSMEQQFFAWSLGAMLFGHVANFFSIALFDQSVFFFYLVLAAIGTTTLSRRQSHTGSVNRRMSGYMPIHCKSGVASHDLETVNR